MANRATSVVGEEGVRQALVDLAGAVLPLSTRELQREVDRRLERLPNQLNEYGYDAYGLSPDFLRQSMLPGILLYKYWFRCETRHIERLPPGRMLLIANHAGQLPFDGMMLSSALLMEAEPPRVARGMAEYFVSRLPFVGTAAARGGAMVGTPANCVHMLENEEAVMVFPEGVRGINKPFSKRYQLQRFGLGFMRLALQTDTPIVPVGIAGSEEQAPGLTTLERLGRVLGTPPVPITATFPWLGPLGLVPLPSKYVICFGEPMRFEGDPNDEDAVIEAQVARVKRAIDELVAEGRAERHGFLG
jgi:1-acyl-sn-glycerol-3-phosphate acyltransferase